MLLGAVRKELGDEITDAHFTPSYNPWDQRLCLLPNGDLYKAIRDGKASVVTDRIASFTAAGIVLESGAELAADIVVTATGLQLVTPGEVRFEVDGEPVDFSDTVTYRGWRSATCPTWFRRSATSMPRGRCAATSSPASSAVCSTTCGQRAPTSARRDCASPTRHAEAAMDRRIHAGLHAAGDGPDAETGRPRAVVNPQLYKAEKAALLKAPLDDGVLQFTRARTAVTA